MTKIKLSGFGKTILDRGKAYFEEGRVSNLFQTGNIITAKVQGSHNYKVTLNLETDNFRCNCPYEGNLCKHIAAVCYAVNKRKNIKKGDNIEETLESKSKEELIKIIKEMLANDNSLSIVLLSKEDQIRQKIEEIDESEDWQEFYDYVPDNIEDVLEEIDNVSNKTELLLLLLEKTQELNLKYDSHGCTEDSIAYIIERLDKLKNNLPKNEIVKLEKEMKRILGEEYDDD